MSLRVIVAIFVAATSMPVGFFDEIAMAAPTQGKDLVLVGRVSSITQGGTLPKPWIVTVDVEKIISGDFSGGQFAFAVHSPSRSGLEVGRSYTVRAAWKGKGYDVDENQWMNGKR